MPLDTLEAGSRFDVQSPAAVPRTALLPGRHDRDVGPSAPVRAARREVSMDE